MKFRLVLLSVSDVDYVSVNQGFSLLLLNLVLLFVYAWAIIMAFALAHGSPNFIQV